MARIQVKSIILKNFKDRLLKLGLEYDTYEDMCWKFSQKEAPFAIVHFQKYRHAPNIIKLCAYSKYYDMIDSSEELEINGFENEIGGFFHYSNEDDLKNILDKMIDYLETSALPKICEDYNTNKVYNEEQLNIQLYENHKNYYDDFLKANPDVYKEHEGIHLDNLCEFIDNELTQIRNSEDSSEKEDLIKLAAFLGTVLEIEFSGEWTLVDFFGEKRVRIDNMQNEVGFSYVMIDILEIYRGKKKIEGLRFMLEYMLESKH